VLNLKSASLTVLELLTFNAQKFRGSRDPGHAPFGKFFRDRVRISLGTRVSNLKSVSLTVLELFAFNAHFKLVRLTGPLRTETQKHRHTSNEHIISAVHFVHLAEIINAAPFFQAVYV